MKKILVLLEEFSTRGGAEVSSDILIRFLEKNFEIEKHVFKSNFLNLLPVNAALFFKVFFWQAKVESLIEKTNPDFIFTQQHLTVLCSRAKKKRAVRVLSFVRDWWFLTPNRREFEEFVHAKQNSVSKKVIGLSDHFFCAWSRKEICKALQNSVVFTISSFMQEKMVQALHIHSELLFPPIEQVFFDVVADTEKKFARKSILLVGRITPEKGVHIVIRAMEKVDARLFVVGQKKGKYYRRCRALGQKKGIKGKVFFVGEKKRSDIPSLLEECTCVVIPSVWQEPFGRLVGEAMATGTPIIVSDRGGLTKNAQRQIIAQPDAGSFAEKLNELLSDYGRYREFSENAKIDSQKYSIERIGKKLLETINAK